MRRCNEEAGRKTEREKNSPQLDRAKCRKKNITRSGVEGPGKRELLNKKRNGVPSEIKETAPNSTRSGWLLGSAPGSAKNIKKNYRR